jgi:plasmid replication initiation protein
MESSLTKQNYSRQSHLIVNAKYAFTRSEIDFILTLLTAISKDDEDFKDYTFDINELESKTFRKWNHSRLQETCESLLSKTLKIEISKNEWKMFSWFSYFEYNHGVITCRFDKALKPYLLEIKNRFVISDLRMILPMRSSYSKRIYLLLKEYAKIGERTFDIKELQEVLQVPKSHKDKYNKFKVAVLKKAETDINKFTDLEVKLSEKKRGRKIVEITYTIRKNTTDLKTFIQIIRENYTNKILFHTKDNKPIMCSTKGLLYFADEDTTIDKKESQKLWEYLHENRENLLVFKINVEETKKQFYLSSMQYFQEYIKEHFANLEIIRLKKRNTDDVLILSIFPNGRLYDMSGEYLDDSSVVEIWKTIYTKAKKDELRIFKEE